MLVLTRMEGEKIMIGDNITIMVKSVIGLQAKIGIDAPREVSVMRDELRERERSAP